MVGRRKKQPAVILLLRFSIIVHWHTERNDAVVEYHTVSLFRPEAERGAASARRTKSMHLQRLRMHQLASNANDCSPNCSRHAVCRFDGSPAVPFSPFDQGNEWALTGRLYLLIRVFRATDIMYRLIDINGWRWSADEANLLLYRHIPCTTISYSLSHYAYLNNCGESARRREMKPTHWKKHNSTETINWIIYENGPSQWTIS